METTKEMLLKQCKGCVQMLIDWHDDPKREEDERGELFNPDEDILDTAYVVGYDGEVRSMRVLLSFGGPNIWFDTSTAAVEGYWGTELVTLSVPQEVGECLLLGSGVERFEPQY